MPPGTGASSGWRPRGVLGTEAGGSRWKLLGSAVPALLLIAAAEAASSTQLRPCGAGVLPEHPPTSPGSPLPPTRPHQYEGTHPKSPRHPAPVGSSLTSRSWVTACTQPSAPGREPPLPAPPDPRPRAARSPPGALPGTHISITARDEHLEWLRLINLGRREMSTANEPLGHLSKLWHIRMQRGKQDAPGGPAEPPWMAED